jgi:hypothetical protein
VSEEMICATALNCFWTRSIWAIRTQALRLFLNLTMIPIKAVNLHNALETCQWGERSTRELDAGRSALAPPSATPQRETGTSKRGSKIERLFLRHSVPYRTRLFCHHRRLDRHRDSLVCCHNNLPYSLKTGTQVGCNNCMGLPSMVLLLRVLLLEVFSKQSKIARQS